MTDDQEWDRRAERLTAEALGTGRGGINPRAVTVDDLFTLEAEMSGLRPDCVATGCTLIDMNEMKHCHGDLHQVGNGYVFSAVMHEGETNWRYENMDSAVRQTKVCVTLLDGAYFERRGVIVFDRRAGHPNEELLAKMQRYGRSW